MYSSESPSKLVGRHMIDTGNYSPRYAFHLMQWPVALLAVPQRCWYAVSSLLASRTP